MKTRDFKAWRTLLQGSEFKIMRLQDAPSEDGQKLPGVLDNPESVIEYIMPRVQDSVRYSPETENLILVAVSARRLPIGFAVISNGTLDTLLVHAREVFRPAIILNASAVILAHNHPSGDPTPSEADIKVTRDMIRAGQLLQIDLLDHVIIGQATPERPKAWSSLRELGYFYT